MFVIFQILIHQTPTSNTNLVQICSTREDACIVATILQNTPNIVAFMPLSHKPSELGWTHQTLKQWSKHRIQGYGFTKEDFAASTLLTTNRS